MDFNHACSVYRIRDPHVNTKNGTFIFPLKVIQELINLAIPQIKKLSGVCLLSHAREFICVEYVYL